MKTLFPILFIFINILLAAKDGYIITIEKKVPNHLLNGAVYLIFCGVPYLIFPLIKSLELTVVLLCIRQIIFEGFLNIYRKRNWFYTSHYTSFYQSNKAAGSNSFIDKIENFFIDGFINLFNRRKWSWTPIIDMNIHTYNNYLNGKIQNIIYGSLLIYFLKLFYEQ